MGTLFVLRTYCASFMGTLLASKTYCASFPAWAPLITHRSRFKSVVIDYASLTPNGHGRTMAQWPKSEWREEKEIGSRDARSSVNLGEL